MNEHEFSIFHREIFTIDDFLLKKHVFSMTTFPGLGSGRQNGGRGALLGSEMMAVLATFGPCPSWGSQGVAKSFPTRWP